MQIENAIENFAIEHSYYTQAQIDAMNKFGGDLAIDKNFGNQIQSNNQSIKIK